MSKKYTPYITFEKAREISNFMRLLDNPYRVLIIHLLSAYGGEMTVDNITESLQTISQATVSHHLKTMKDLKLIDCTKHGTYAYYFINYETLEAIKKGLGVL